MQHPSPQRTKRLKWKNKKYTWARGLAWGPLDWKPENKDGPESNLKPLISKEWAAPPGKSWLSNTKTSCSYLASSDAQERPAIPLPMTTTSASGLPAHHSAVILDHSGVVRTPAMDKDSSCTKVRSETHSSNRFSPRSFHQWKTSNTSIWKVYLPYKQIKTTTTSSDNHEKKEGKMNCQHVEIIPTLAEPETQH